MNERPLNTAEQSLGDLAIACGMWQAMGATQPQIDCFVESVLVLASGAGLSKQVALQPFDVNRKHAEAVWDRISAALAKPRRDGKL